MELRIEDLRCVVAHVFFYFTFVTKFPMTKFAKPMNGLMWVFNVGSLIRARSCLVFCISYVLESYVSS